MAYQQEYLRPFLDDGMPVAKATSRLDSICEVTQTVLGVYGTQEQLEQGINRDPRVSANPPYLGMAIEILPGLMMARDEGYAFSMSSWMQAVAEPFGCLKFMGLHHRRKIHVAAKAMRYYELWGDELDKSERADVLKGMRANDCCYGVRAFALYGDKLLGSEEVDDDVLNLVFEGIAESRELLALISTTRMDMIPLAYQEQILPWLEASEEPIELDSVRTVRTVDRFFGIDDCLFEEHERTFLGGPCHESSEGLATLLYVGGNLVGSMSMSGEPSILGLQDVVGSDGSRRTLLGGVYGTNKAVIREARMAFGEKGRFARLNLDSLDLYPLRTMAYILFDPEPSDFHETVEKIKERRDEVLVRR